MQTWFGCLIIVDSDSRGQGPQEVSQKDSSRGGVTVSVSSRLFLSIEETARRKQVYSK